MHRQMVRMSLAPSKRSVGLGHRMGVLSVDPNHSPSRRLCLGYRITCEEVAESPTANFNESFALRSHISLKTAGTLGVYYKLT